MLQSRPVFLDFGILSQGQGSLRKDTEQYSNIYFKPLSKLPQSSLELRSVTTAVGTLREKG